MSNRSLAGRVSAFTHLLGARRAKAVEQETPPAETTTADDGTATTNEVEQVQEEVDETKDKVDELEERIEALEGADTSNEVEDADAEPEDPAAKKAWQAGRRVGMKAGIAAERTRGSAIFKAQEAGENPFMAAHLAFETDMTAQQAIGTLRASTAGSAPAPKANRKGLDQRMANQPQPRLGADGGKPSAPEGSAQAHIDRIAAAARAVGVAPAQKR
jgi:hypothetical protein